MEQIASGEMLSISAKSLLDFHEMEYIKSDMDY
jgi:hypothetical protein